MSKKLKTITMGLAVAVTSGLTSCENKKESQDENLPQTEQTNYEVGKSVLQDISGAGISTVKRAHTEEAVDSVLSSVEVTLDKRAGDGKYNNPTYIAAENANPRKAKVKLEFAEKDGDNNKARIEFTYDKKTKQDSINEARELAELEASKNKAAEWGRDVKFTESNNEGAVRFEYVPTHAVLERRKATYENWPDENNWSDENIQANTKQSKPEKKEPPKGSISHDAFINALLEQKRGHGKE